MPIRAYCKWLKLDGNDRFGSCYGARMRSNADRRSLLPNIAMSEVLLGFGGGSVLPSGHCKWVSGLPDPSSRP